MELHPGMFAFIITLFLTVLACFATGNNHDKAKEVEKYKLRQVSVDVVNATSILLRWEHPKEADPIKCPIKRYTVRLKTEGAKRSRTWKIDGSRQSITLHDLVAGTVYYARLLAVACDGKGKPSRWVRVRTTDSVGEDAQADGTELQAPGKPTYVRTRTFTDTVIVSWLPPEENIVVRGYMVGYGEGVPDVNWQYVEANRRNVTIKNLKPATQYIVSLRAFNNFGKGQVVYDLIYTRENTASTGTSTMPPTNLRAKILSPTTAWLQWTDPSLGRQQQISDNRYYNVHYQAVQPVPSKTLSVIVKALHVVLYDLMPGTKYEFKVRTVKDAQASPFSDGVSNKTFETAPSSAPRSVTIMATNSSTSALVSWRPPRHPNGDITGYLILYTSRPELAVDQWQVYGVTGDYTECTISDLTANTTYHFKVQARNSNGYGPTSSTMIHYTRLYAGAPIVKLPPQTNEDEPETKDEKNQLSSDTSTTPEPTDISDIDDDDDTDDEYDDVSDDDVIQSAALVVGVTTTTTTTTTTLSPDSVENSDATGGGKAKREHTYVELPSAAALVGEDRGKPAAQNDGTGQIPVSFRALVSHVVSAYVTWPENVVACSTSRVTGYRLRYRRVEDAETNDFIVRNLATNVVLLDGLVPNTRYQYQVKYLLQNSAETSWSQVAILDTRADHKL